MTKLYKFAVALPGRKEVVVQAPDRLMATKEAAKRLGVVWRETARDMTVNQISKRPCGKHERRNTDGKGISGIPECD